MHCFRAVIRPGKLKSPPIIRFGCWRGFLLIVLATDEMRASNN